MNRTLPELLLKSRANKILSFLTLHRNESFYDKEISEHTAVSRGATNQILNDFAKNNLVTREKRGKAWFYSITDQPLINHYRIFENLISLAELLNYLKPLCKRIVLFGSATLGTDTKDSDIDLFILSDESEKVSSVIQKFKSEREINPVILTPIEYAVSQANDKAFFQEVKKGIVLFEKETDEQGL